MGGGEGGRWKGRGVEGGEVEGWGSGERGSGRRNDVMVVIQVYCDNEHNGENKKICE